MVTHKERLEILLKHEERVKRPLRILTTIFFTFSMMIVLTEASLKVSIFLAMLAMVPEIVTILRRNKIQQSFNEDRECQRLLELERQIYYFVTPLLFGGVILLLMSPFSVLQIYTGFMAFFIIFASLPTDYIRRRLISLDSAYVESSDLIKAQEEALWRKKLTQKQTKS